MPETNDPEKLRAMLKIERSYATTLKQIQLDTSISILGSGIVLCLTVAVLLANIAMAYTRARELALEVQSLKERQRTSAPRDRSEDPRRASRLAPLSHQ